MNVSNGAYFQLAPYAQTGRIRRDVTIVAGSVCRRDICHLHLLFAKVPKNRCAFFFRLKPDIYIKMCDKIQVYVTSVSSSGEIKAHQQRIRMILESKKIDFEEVDISTNAELKDKMRDIAGSPQAMPPQIARGKTYLGDYEAFDEAVESECLEEFLKL